MDFKCEHVFWSVKRLFCHLNVKGTQEMSTCGWMIGGGAGQGLPLPLAPAGFCRFPVTMAALLLETECLEDAESRMAPISSRVWFASPLMKVDPFSFRGSLLSQKWPWDSIYTMVWGDLWDLTECLEGTQGTRTHGSGWQSRLPPHPRIPPCGLKVMLQWVSVCDSKTVPQTLRLVLW